MGPSANTSTQENQYAQWQAAVAAALNKGKAPDKHLDGEQAEAKLTLTVDGLTIKPLYEDNLSTRHSPRPGAMPFTRGTTTDRGKKPAWQIAALHDEPQPNGTTLTNELTTGATSVWFRVERDGLHPDHVNAALELVDSTTTPVLLSSVHCQQAVFEAVKKQLTAHTRIHVGIDPFSVAQATRTPVDVSLAATAITEVGSTPGVTVCTVDTTHAHLAGAHCTDQVAIAGAGGIDLLRSLTAAGITSHDAWRHIAFRYAVDQDQFQNIAMLRAARRVWARVGEILDIPNEQRGAHLHAVTSERMMSKVDPYNNMLRTTIASFSAGLGGAQVVTTLPFDHPFGLPTDFSRRMARNTQALLLQESHLGQVIDPAGGSTYVEDLTDQIAETAWAQIQTIEEHGGLGEYITAGKLTELCATRAADRAERIAHRAQPLTGVTEFAPLTDVDVDRTPRPDRSDTGLPVHRDSQVAEELRHRGTALTTPQGAYTIPVLCLGEYKQYSARLSFVRNVLAIAGLAAEAIEINPEDPLVTDLSTAPAVLLAASPGSYAESGSAALAAANAAGAHRIIAAGRDVEWADTEKPTEYLNVRSNVVAFLTSVLDAAEQTR